MYKDYLGDIHKRRYDVERGIGDARRSRARRFDGTLETATSRWSVNITRRSNKPK